MRLIIALTMLALSPGLALAHTGSGHATGFFHGFGHPIGGTDHVLAMLAVGILAYVLGGRALWLVPLSFVGMMLAGFVLGVLQADIPFVELAIALSSVVIGAAAALGRSMPAAGAMTLVGIFAMFHGHAHGAEMPAGASGLTYALGFAFSTALLHLFGIGTSLTGARLVGRHGKAAAQLAGAGLALGGIGVLAGWL